MNRAIDIAILILTLATVVPAQEKQTESKPAVAPDSPLPSVNDVLDRYIQALGGKDAIGKFSSRVVKGSFEIPTMGVTSSAEIYAKRPNKWILTVDVPGLGLYQQAYDGSVGWTQDPQSGVRDLTGGELAAIKRSAEFNQPLRLKELYQTIAVKGRSKVGDRDAYVLEATPSEGSPEKLYFDTQSNLLIKADIQAESPMGKMPFEVFFEDYKEVEGIKMPHTMRRTSEAIGFVIKIEEVKFDVPIEDDKFKKPAADKPAQEKDKPAQEKKIP